MRAICLRLLTAGALAAATSAPPPDIERLYKVKCAACHGTDGSGGTGVSFRGKLARRTPAEISGVIKAGIPGTAMPPSRLPDPAVKKLAAYVLYLHQRK